MPTSAPSTAAQSATERPCGPTVSCVAEIGTTPARLVSPTVGLMPATPDWPDGQTIDPSVSVPSEAAVSAAATAAADPELEPQGLRSSTHGLPHCPPAPLQPLELPKPRKLAHSLRFALPRITAPARRSRRATVASCSAGRPTSASEPARVP